MSTMHVETLKSGGRQIHLLRTDFADGDLWEVWWCDASAKRAILAGTGTTRDHAVGDAARLADSISHALQSTPSPAALAAMERAK